MTRARSIRQAASLRVGIMAALSVGLAIALQGAPPTPLPTGTSTAAPDPGMPVGTELAAACTAASLAGLEDLTTRPPFMPTRRPPPVIMVKPPPPVAPAAPPSPSPPPGLTLVGTAVLGGVRVALVRVPPGDTTMRLKVGESVEGWAVADIAGDTVTMKKMNTTFELKFPPPLVRR